MVRAGWYNYVTKKSRQEPFLALNWDNKQRFASKGSDSITARHDPMGNRLWRAGTNTRKYIVDIAGKLPVILCEVDASDGSLENSYLWADGQILARYTHNTDETVDEKFYYVHDRLGSVRMVIGYDGSDAYVENHYTCAPFGQTLESAENTCNPFQFTGQWYDEETSEYYLRARMYDPTMMRFTTRDPTEANANDPLTLHKYLYCANDSVNRIDPEGEMFIPIFSIVGLVAGTTIGQAFDHYQYIDVTLKAKIAGTIVATFAGSLVDVWINSTRSIQDVAETENMHIIRDAHFQDDNGRTQEEVDEAIDEWFQDFTNERVSPGR